MLQALPTKLHGERSSSNNIKNNFAIPVVTSKKQMFPLVEIM
ncbi:hypothetical protein AVEN_274984-1, partial [Araneus ventricosus]